MFARRGLGSLRRLLLVYEFALLGLLVVTGGISLVWAYVWQEASRESVRINQLMYETQQIRSDLFRQIKEVALTRVTENAAALTVYGNYSREIDGRFNTLRQRSASREEDLAIQELQRAYRAIQTDMNKIFADPYLMNEVVRLKILDPRYEQALVGEFEQGFSRMRVLLGRQSLALESRMQRWRSLAAMLLPVPVVLAVVLVLASRASLKRGFVQPVSELTAGAEHFSRGEWEHRVPETGVTEIAGLSRAMNHMAGELARARDKLVESEKQAALGALVPVVAHNIRNPLASIRASAQLLDHADEPAELKEIKDAIVTTVDRLGRWVSALVSYLHPLKPHTQRINAAAMLDAALQLLAPRLAEKSLRVVAENWDRQSLVDVDADLMEQALYGLMSNAADASPQGGTLTLAAVRQGDRYVMSIEDQGPGMPFMPQHTGLAPGPSFKRMGTGLGIPVAFKVCRAHGWSLKFGEAAGGGTRVSISAPIAATAEEAA